MKSFLKRTRDRFMMLMERRDCNVSVKIIFINRIAGAGSGGGTGGSQGFGGHHFSGGAGFTFRHAEDIFKDFFGGKDPFASFFDEQDDFF